MASGDATPLPIKNTAFRATFDLRLNTGALNSGAAGLDSEASKDAGTFADCTNEATEIATSSGHYTLDLTSTEMNADTVAIQIKSSTTNAVTRTLVIYPQSLGKVKVDVQSLLGTAWLTPGTAGTPDVNVKLWNALATVALPLIPTTAGRTLDVSAGGEAGLDWANIGSPTTTVAFTGSTIAATQKVDVDTIKTNPVVNAGTITFPTGATLASTTNITAGTITTVTNQLTAAAIATGVWQDATSGDFTVASSIGKSLFTSGAAPGAAGGLFIAGTNAATTVTTAFTTTFTGNLTGSVASVTGAVASVSGNVGGNVVGSVASIATGGIVAASFAANAITASAIGADAIGASELAADAVTEIQSGLSTLTSTDIATAVWNAATASFGTAGSYGLLVETNLDAAVSSRMATYTQPTGFLAATFPGTVASTTNITGGTITTVTTLTNLPAITANWLTAAGTASDFGTEVGTAVWASGTRTLTSGGGSGGLSAQETRDAMLLAPSGGGDSGSIDVLLQTILSTVTASSGAGAFPITVHVTDGSTALQNAIVRVKEGVNTFVATTDSAGHASFSLDAATYAVTITKGGYAFTPTTRTVTGSQTGTLTSDLAMTITAVVGPSDPSLCLVSGYCISPSGDVAAGVKVTFTLLAPAGVSSGSLVAQRIVTATSGTDGLISQQLIRNDFATPTGTHWRINSATLGLSNRQVTLNSPTYDLGILNA